MRYFRRVVMTRCWACKMALSSWVSVPGRPRRRKQFNPQGSMLSVPVFNRLNLTSQTPYLKLLIDDAPRAHHATPRAPLRRLRVAVKQIIDPTTILRGALSRERLF